MLFFNKSQSSMEFLMIFGIGFFITLTIGGLFFNFFNSEKSSLDDEYINSLVSEIMTKVEQIYFLGSGNKITMKIKIPEDILNITIHHINNITGPFGDKISYDYLNISYSQNGNIYYNIFETNELYIRFNCSDCHHDLTTNVSWYNSTSSFYGSRQLRIKSVGDWVNIDFVE